MNRLLGLAWLCLALLPFASAETRSAQDMTKEVHWWMQAGQTPPVSNEFHSCPQVHNHRSSLRGDQPHSRAADARTRWLPALLFLNLAIRH